MEFQKLLDEFKKLALPDGKYVIYGSGPLGVRKIREAKDLDVVVTNDLYRELLKKYPETRKNATELLKVVRFINIGNIEVIPADCSLIKNIKKSIKEADIIGGIRFARLKDLVIWKRKMARPKDFEDIKLIENYLSKKEMNKIYFVTSNKNKLREFEEILGFSINNIALDLDEIQAIEVEKVVKHKVKQAFEKVKKPVIAEDTGLYIESLNGLPGALGKFFDKTIGYSRLCKLVHGNRKALAKTVIGYFDGLKYRDFVGKIEGSIAKEAKGDNNFGWDIIFIPKGFNITLAQMSSEEKNKISMRKIALEKFKEFWLKK
jgi:XTP/dITP diphosphohydrolase